MMLHVLVFAVPVLLALVGMPLFAVMGLSALLNHWHADMNLQGVVIMFYGLSNQPLLQALPVFAFMGYLLAASRAPKRLVRLSNACLGWLPGGLAIVAIVACSLMTAFTGASGITVLALGGLLLPAMRANAYSERFSMGVITSGGSLGLLFVPSLPIILYGVVAECNIDRLFRAGVLPGVLAIGLLSVYALVHGVRQELPRQAFSWRELGGALWEGKWDVPLPAIVIGGIYSGVLVLSEAAVVAAVYTLFITVCVHRDVKWRHLGRIARQSAVLTAGILMILGMAMAVTNYMVDDDVPTRFFELASPWMTNKLTFLLALNLFLLALGCMLDIYSAIVLIVPLLLPIAARFNVDPVHLGIVFLANMGIGYITPPVGLNLFVASLRFRKPIWSLYWACLPFTLVLLLALLLITLFPKLSLWLAP